jgi:hypothetical protein
LNDLTSVSDGLGRGLKLDQRRSCALAPRGRGSSIPPSDPGLKDLQSDSRHLVFQPIVRPRRIFKSERQLVGIDAFRTAAELHSLQPFDDRSQALDLTFAMFDRADNIADQAMQKFCIYRELPIAVSLRFCTILLGVRENFLLVP